MADPGGARGAARPAWLWLGALGVAALLVRLPHAAPLLVWNASTSSPRGLYLLVPGHPRVGDYVIARPPAAASALAAARGYLPQGLALVKTKAAGAGDRVCAQGPRLVIEGRIAVRRLRADRLGRVLPWWEGCRRLASDETVLLGLAHAASFDSRYFGPVGTSSIIGRARLVWRD